MSRAGKPERGLPQKWRTVQEGEATIASYLNLSDPYPYNIQSCGLCDGMTKHESNSDCYDTATAEECSTIVENECYKNQKACKKVMRIDHD